MKVKKDKNGEKICSMLGTHLAIKKVVVDGMFRTLSVEDSKMEFDFTDGVFIGERTERDVDWPVFLGLVILQSDVHPVVDEGAAQLGKEIIYMMIV